MASVAKKRKVDSEGRRFQERWKLEYFFTEIRNSCVCLICHETVAVFKEFNIRRHYQTKHSNYDNLTGYERSETLKQLEAVLSAQQSFFTTARESHENATKASYDVATLIASHCIPFTEGEFIYSISRCFTSMTYHAKFQHLFTIMHLKSGFYKACTWLMKFLQREPVFPCFSNLSVTFKQWNTAFLIFDNK